MSSKLKRDSEGQKIQVMPLAKLSTGVVTITDQTLIEMESGSSIIVTQDDGATYDIVATEMRRYSIPEDVATISVTGNVRIV